MNRAELIAKARAYLKTRDWVPHTERLASYYADFALPLLAAERERAIEECYGAASEEGPSVIADRIRRRIRALLRPAAETDKPEVGGLAAGVATPVPANSQPPALHADAETLERWNAHSDADVLKRSAEIISERFPVVPKHGENAIGEWLLEKAKQLREPAPDVFERVAAEWHDIPYKQKILAALLRERFGPVVEALEDLLRTTRYLKGSGGTGIGTRNAINGAEHALARLAGQPARASEQALLRLGEQSSPSPAGEEER